MPENLDDYRSELLNNILFATSPLEVKEIMEAVFLTLDKKRFTGFVIMRFIVKTLIQLERFHPGEYNSRQWLNICAAKEIIYNKKKFLNPKIASVST